VKGIIKRITIAGLLIGAVLVPAASATATEIDFSRHGQGPFGQSFYRSSGVAFTQGSYVGYIQGDEAVVGPLAGKFKPKISSLSARFAPAIQGTATYTLSALNPAGRVIESTSVTVTQDTGDPKTQPFDYVTIDLGTLPKKASAFSLTNEFVRSSYPHITGIDFGVSSINY
jgi:hypothetical protein